MFYFDLKETSAVLLDMNKQRNFVIYYLKMFSLLRKNSKAKKRIGFNHLLNYKCYEIVYIFSK